MSDKDILTYGYLKEASKNADFISRLEAVVEEISKYEESLIHDVHYDTGYEDGKNEVARIIHVAFPELKNVQRPKSES